MTEAESMEYDVVIVGAGPAGLSAAIRLRQLSIESGREISVCVLEKGSEIGAHILAGGVLEPRALNELIPDWKEKGAPLDTPVVKDKFLLMGKKSAIRLPTPPQMHNKGNYIISLGNVVRWLGQQAESLGVQIFPGFPAADILLQGNRVVGVITGEFGRARDGKEKPSYQPGMEIRGKYVLFAEGCRGSLSERIMEHFKLRRSVQPQSYAIGIKELWELAPEKREPGTVIHTVGWPLDNSTYGGSFLYHKNNGQLAIGLVVGLDYSNPHLDPYMEFQRLKTHPVVSAMLEGGKRISYGARALNEGGYQSIPRLIFPGGALIGCSAGFMNVPKIKGAHTAMKSGMVAAESVFEALSEEGEDDGLLENYMVNMRASWVYPELYKVRNIRPGFHLGLWAGMINAALETYIFRGKMPWTLGYKGDHKTLKKAASCKRISYPKPDGKLTFDRMSSVFLSSTNHEEDQPVHLTLKNPNVPVQVNLKEYDAPEQRYCPAGVYEIVKDDGNQPRLQINAQNCVHCKTCDIKDPTQNIVWVTPEGGGGPNYSGM